MFIWGKALPVSPKCVEPKSSNPLAYTLIPIHTRLPLLHSTPLKGTPCKAYQIWFPDSPQKRRWMPSFTNTCPVCCCFVFSGFGICVCVQGRFIVHIVGCQNYGPFGVPIITCPHVFEIGVGLTTPRPFFACVQIIWFEDFAALAHEAREGYEQTFLSKLKRVPWV